MPRAWHKQRDLISGGKGNDYLEGGEGNDTLNGGDGIDILKGGAGADTFNGGKGIDILEGGDGSNTFIVEADGGSDLIRGTDHVGDSIKLEGNVLSGSVLLRPGGGIGEDDNENRYMKTDTGLVIMGKNGARVVIEHWQNGDFGLSLTEDNSLLPDIPNVQTSLTLTGDRKLIDQDPNTEGDQPGYDDLGNEIVDSNEVDVRDDVLYGSNDNDLIEGGGGDLDWLIGNQGDDILRGQQGQDFLLGGSGNDLLEGGEDDDVLGGGTGNDVLVAGSLDDVLDVLTSSGLEQGIGHDFLEGAEGDDVLIGNAGTNFLAGGGGKDKLYGGAGDDYLDGDWNLQAQEIDWQATKTGGNVTFSPFITIGNTKAHDFGDDDEFFAGAGDDYVWAGAGNDEIAGDASYLAAQYHGDDVLYGGTGDDQLVSGGGNDVLIGGDDNDTLLGDNGNLSPSAHGDDSYVWQQGVGFELIDNVGGGQDWLFFNGVNRNRLAFHRDGDDLVINVDNDETLGARVLDHFKNSEQAMSYIQPADGYAIPASQIDALLTPMPVLGSGMAALTESSLELLVNAMATFHPANGVMDQLAQNAISNTTLLGTSYATDYGQQRLEDYRQA